MIADGDGDRVDDHELVVVDVLVDVGVDVLADVGVDDEPGVAVPGPDARRLSPYS